jgi:hypothetical protein
LAEISNKALPINNTLSLKQSLKNYTKLENLGKFAVNIPVI